MGKPVNCNVCHTRLMANGSIEEAKVAFPSGCPYCQLASDNGRVGSGTANIEASKVQLAAARAKPDGGFEEVD